VESPDLRNDILAELRRIGLSGGPGLAAASPESGRRLLAHLRSLPVGASWSDATPELADGGLLRHPSPYVPLGAWDYPDPPHAPAFHLIHETATAPWVARLLAAAALDKIPIHAGGRLEQPAGETLGPEHAFVIVRRGVPDAAIAEVWAWLDRYPHVTVASRLR
jgi:hypothetical protein